MWSEGNLHIVVVVNHLNQLLAIRWVVVRSMYVHTYTLEILD